jgi:hypothetical protein
LDFAKNSDETVRNIYFVVVLVNKSITIRSPYTKYVLLNVSYTTALRCVNLIKVGFFNGPLLMDIFEKTIETEVQLKIISEILPRLKRFN